MRNYMRAFTRHLALAMLAWGATLFGDNQTPTVSPILPGNGLPFQVTIEQDDFSLPNGIHSGAVGVHKGKWLFIAGRTNGLHGFEDDDDNFPPQAQNTFIYVVDPKTKSVVFRSLTDPSSGLSQEQVDFLSVTSPQSYQDGHRLYMTGGYGVDSSTGQFSTKPILTAIDIPGLMHWVLHPDSRELATKYIRQIQDPIFQVTGGFMAKGADDLTLLIFGQNFTGFYETNANGNYTEQVRRFIIIDNGKELKVRIREPIPVEPYLDYRRRDLNVVPIVKHRHGKLKSGFVALSGVFTLTGGAWTVPVSINLHGVPYEPDPTASTTFKQGMNNYVSAAFGMFSKKHRDMYTVLLGGISYGYFQEGEFETDDELPFINQVTTIKIKRGVYSQYIMPNQYPVILSTQSNPGNQLLFGAGADFMLADNVKVFKNGVIRLDDLPRNHPKVVGYIVGGIMSTLPNTNTQSDSAASPYIFKVMVVRRD